MFTICNVLDACLYMWKKNSSYKLIKTLQKMKIFDQCGFVFWCLYDLFGSFGYLDFQLRDRTLSGFIKNVFIWFWRLTNVVRIWKYVMVSKWWQHMNFWVNYPFKNIEYKVSRSCPVRIFISPLKQKHLRDVCLESVVLEIMLVKIISIYLFIACLLLWPSKSEKQ